LGCRTTATAINTTETHVRSANLTDLHHPCCVLRQNTLQSYAPFENRVIVIRHVSGRGHAVHGCSALLVHEDAILCLDARVGHEIDIWFDPDADDREIAGDPPPAFRDDPLDASGALECHDSIFEDGLDTMVTMHLSHDLANLLAEHIKEWCSSRMNCDHFDPFLARSVIAAFAPARLAPTMTNGKAITPLSAERRLRCAPGTF
jgi:hypothetical protein